MVSFILWAVPSSIEIDKNLSAAVQSVQSIDFVFCEGEVNKDPQEVLGGLIVSIFLFRICTKLTSG